MGHATEGFEVLGAAHGLGARGSVSGSGVQLGLDRTSDETRGWVHKAVVPVRTHRPRGAGGGCGGRAGDARGCLPQSGGLGTRESESVRPWHTPDSLDRGRRADIRKARGATRESVQFHGARSAEVRTRSRWRDLELEDSLPELLGSCGRILNAVPVFVLLNVYVTVLTQARMAEEAEGLQSRLKSMLGESRITITAGELALQDAAGRRISASVFARGSASEMIRSPKLRADTRAHSRKASVK